MANAALASARAKQRSRLIKLIHVARRDLQLDEDTYRGIVADKANGKTSTADCTVPQLEIILGHLKAAGFKVRKPKAAAPTERRQLDTDAEAQKVRALWLLLHEIDAVRNPSEAALAAYVRRITGVDDMRWADGGQMTTLIETMKKWAMRYLPKRTGELWQQLHGTGIRTLTYELGRYNEAQRRGTFDPYLGAYQAICDRLKRLNQEPAHVADPR